MDTLQYRDIFINESLEHLDYLNQMLLALEKNPSDKQSLNEIFRAAHTLKGMAATMGFDQITELTHQMESVLDKLRGSGTVVSSEMVDVLFQCLDMLSVLVEEISSSEPKNLDVEALLERLREFESDAPAAEKRKAEAKPAAAPASASASEDIAEARLEDIARHAGEEGFATYGVSVTLEDACAFKGVRAFMVCKALNEHGEIIASQPEAKRLQEGEFEKQFHLLLLSKKSQDILKKSLHGIAEVQTYEIREVSADEAEKFLGRPVKPAAAASAAQAPDSGEAKNGAAKNRAAVQSIRVSIERLDNLQNLVGELVISKIRLSQLSKQHDLRDLKEALAQFDRITNELQDEVTEVRMVPMEHIFNRFPRMVRDLAKESGKEVDLVMEGKDIELDRTVLDEINDPLVHLLRNAVDHGVELPAERERAGKSRVGMVRLVAAREKNHVIIKVSDDGKGIDPSEIKQVCLDKGLITSEDANRMSDQEAVNLITLPGVTTAKVVTEISGRGVGVDAVRTKIESFGGSLRIESRIGEGSTFILRMPMTLAIIQALLVRVGKEIYSLPVINAVETLELSAAQIKWVQKKEVVLYRDSVLPLVRLHHVLDTGLGELRNEDQAILVTEVGDMRVGLLVDEVLGQQEIAIKSLGPMLKGVKGFSGVTILGDGHIALVLDVPSLI